MYTKRQEQLRANTNTARVKKQRLIQSPCQDRVIGCREWQKHTGGGSSWCDCCCDHANDRNASAFIYMAMWWKWLLSGILYTYRVCVCVCLYVKRNTRVTNRQYIL